MTEADSGDNPAKHGEPGVPGQTGQPGVPVKHYRSPVYRMKSALLGPPIDTADMEHERITKRVALAVFSSDPISSTAYATEEILLVLVLAGAVTTWALPVAVAIVGLLLLLVISYRQVIDAYPSAGGAYVVSRDNFGTFVSAIAGAALLIDYVLTVAVSVASGVEAMVSVWPTIATVQVEVCLAFVIILAWANLRGLKEAGRLFAIPTYVYVVSVGIMVVVGWFRSRSGLGHMSYTAVQQSQLVHATQPLHSVTFFLLLRAFASGTTALTGVEAVSNGVSAFRKPQARNAKSTLLVMALLMGSLFLGITYLAGTFHVLPYANGYPTVLAQVTDHAFGTSPLGQAAFIVVQGATLFILVLAANTSFSGFPLLASFAADDALLPRQLRKRGHRLVYSNGVIVLAVVAMVLVLVSGGKTHALIPLYAIGVITSFTLAQAGMVVRHFRLREPHWQYGLLINGLGAVVTMVVLGVITVAKFGEGAKYVMIAMPVIVYLLLRTQRTYDTENNELRLEAFQRLKATKEGHDVVVLVEHLDQATLAGLQYAQELRADIYVAVHVAIDPDATAELQRLWQECRITFPLRVVEAPDRNLLATIEEAVAAYTRPDAELTVLVPKRVYRHWWSRFLHDRTSAGVFHVLEGMEGVHVAIVPFRLHH